MPTTSASTPTHTLSQLENASEFHARHIGITAADEALMLQAIGENSRADLIASIVPASIARSSKMDIPAAITEAAALAELYRPGLLRHTHTRRHPAQHFGKPGLVHRLHALPG
jgi:glycine dehydrogenase